MSDFPFDSHDLCVSKFISGGNQFLLPNGDSCYFVQVDSIGAIGLDHTAWLPNVRSITYAKGAFEAISDEWHVCKPQMILSSEEKEIVQLSFVVVRKHESFLFNGFFMVLLLMLMAFTSFGLEPDSLSDRLSLLITVTLTLVALKFALADKIPTSEKVNYLDQYLIAGIFFCACMMIVNAAIVKANHLDDINDGIFFIISLGSYVLYNVVSFGVMYQKTLRSYFHSISRAEKIDTPNYLIRGLIEKSHSTSPNRAKISDFKP
jgi:hypothetical protein